MYWKMQMYNISIAVESSTEHPFIANIYLLAVKNKLQMLDELSCCLSHFYVNYIYLCNYSIMSFSPNGLPTSQGCFTLL